MFAVAPGGLRGRLSVDYSEHRTDGTPIPVTSGGDGGTRRFTHPQP